MEKFETLCEQPTVNEHKADYVNGAVRKFDILIREYSEYFMVIHLIINDSLQKTKECF